MAVSALIVYADDFVADVGYGVVGPGTVQVLSGTLPSQFRCLVEEWCGVARQLEDESCRFTHILYSNLLVYCSLPGG